MPSGSGRRAFQSSQDAQSSVGANILKALGRGFTGLPIEVAAWISGVDPTQAMTSVHGQLGLAAPTLAQDPARYREEDPHPQTTEVKRLLEHGAGEFLGSLALPMPKIEQLKAAAAPFSDLATDVGRSVAQRVPAVAKLGERIERVTKPGTPESRELPTAGMRTQWLWLQKLEASLAKVPGGAAITEAVRNLNVRYADNTLEIIDRMTGGGDVSAETVGTAIREQIENRNVSMRAEGEHLYGEVDRLVPPETAVHIPNTMSTLSELSSAPQKFVEHPLTGAPSLEDVPSEAAEAMTKGLKQFQTWYSALRKDIDQFGVIPYGTIKKLRTEIGQEVDQGVFASMPNAKMRRLYAAVSDDMMNAAQHVGDEAFAAAKRANEGWAGIKREQAVLENVLKKFGGPERVLASLIQTGVRTKWGGGATVIRQVLDAVDEPTHRLIAGSVLHVLGRAPNGLQEAARSDTFNAASFMTNWSSLSHEAVHALFDTLAPEYARDVNRLVENMAALKNYGRLMPNPSGTATAWWSSSELQAFVAALISGKMFGPAGALSIAGLYGANRAVAAALTNPQSVRWLADKTAGMLLFATKSTSAIRHRPKAIEEPEEDETLKQPDFSDLAR